MIDVRTPAEFREVHVVGSENTPLDSLNPDAIAQSRRPGPLFVLCRSGKRAEQAAQRLIDAGLDDVVCVEGGVQACQSAGLPLSQGRKAMSLERQVRIGAGALGLVGSGPFLVASGVSGNLGVRRGRSCVRRRHGHLRHGHVASADAVE